MSKLSKNDTPTLTLSIIHLDHSINQIHRPIADTATRVLDHLSCSTPTDAPKALPFPSTKSTPLCCPTLREKVEKSILRYRRDPDRWTSFTSLLLKSLAFYRSLDPSLGIDVPITDEMEDDTLTRMEKLKINETKQIIPIVDLPRTKYNRPYLPQLDGKSCCTSSTNVNQEEEEVNENYNSMMNVSHQYPWVCMAQQQIPSIETSKPHLLGLDIVVFDAKISQYIPTIPEFLKSFVQSFTPWEWGRIINCEIRASSSSWLFGRNKSTRSRSDESQLREFFLRWSMKEAYTKALGLGMHINFHEIETLLYGVDLDVDKDDCGERDEGIWTWMMRQKNDSNNSQTGSSIGQHQFSVIGKVKRIQSQKPCDYWEFIFIPLGNEIVAQSGLANNETPSQLSNDTSSSYNACACICSGPLAKNASGSYTKRNKAAIESLTLGELIQLHGSNPL